MLSSNLTTLLGSYHPNVLRPDQVDYEIGAYFYELDELEQNSLLVEMKTLIDEKKINSELLSRRTGEVFLNDQHAVAFFTNLYKFLSNIGPEPDISEYIE
ncbi:hypothetical protein [Tritonibacter mobilis]|uniref:hypothetical protein n=1 Tax=Tritonibacter mobilis TaxID=379347 RepID=UPI000806DB29|nr:hypothetical protein [Tritonibacter mobilis]